ncbi:MAG: ABC transporter ATP-binding protein [Leptolyngbyaceae cyanobacterium]
MTAPPPPKPNRLWATVKNTPRLFRLVWQATPQWFLLSLFITLASALIPVAQLYVGKLIVDWVVQNAGAIDRPIRPLIQLVGIEFGLVLLQSLLSQGQIFVFQVMKDRFALDANQVLLQQAIALDLAHYERPEFHDLLSRAQQSGGSYLLRVLDILTRLVGQVVGLVGLLALLLKFNPAVTAILFLTATPAFWVGVRYSRRRFWMMRRQTPNNRLSEYFERVLTQAAFAKEVRLFNLGDYLLEQWRQIRGQFNQESAQLAGRQALANVGIGTFASSGFYAAYGVVLAQAVAGRITIGDLTLYTGTFQQAQSRIQGILSSIALLYEYGLYVSQYFEFLDLTPQVISPRSPQSFPVPIQQGLALSNVTFTYPGASTPTLQNINLTVAPGECIALVGVNGSGITTLLKLLNRFYDLDSGDITIDEVPLSAFDLVDLRRNVGVLFQDFARYALSVEDNIGFGNLTQRENPAAIRQAASNAGATGVITTLDQGYETILGKIFKDGIELSGGQWQKIGLARAFMGTAQILILDEPTAAVDAIAEHELFQRFRQLTQGKMTFLVSHRFSTVRIADRIVVLENGQIAEVGNHSQLMAEGGLYAQMFRLQAERYQLESPK